MSLLPGARLDEPGGSAKSGCSDIALLPSNVGTRSPRHRWFQKADTSPSVISAGCKPSLTSHCHRHMVQKPVHNFNFSKYASRSPSNCSWIRSLDNRPKTWLVGSGRISILLNLSRYTLALFCGPKILQSSSYWNSSEMRVIPYAKGAGPPESRC